MAPPHRLSSFFVPLLSSLFRRAPALRYACEDAAAVVYDEELTTLLATPPEPLPPSEVVHDEGEEPEDEDDEEDDDEDEEENIVSRTEDVQEAPETDWDELREQVRLGLPLDDRAMLPVIDQLEALWLKCKPMPWVVNVCGAVSVPLSADAHSAMATMSTLRPDGNLSDEDWAELRKHDPRVFELIHTLSSEPEPWATLQATLAVASVNAAPLLVVYITQLYERLMNAEKVRDIHKNAVTALGTRAYKAECMLEAVRAQASHIAAQSANAPYDEVEAAAARDTAARLALRGLGLTIFDALGLT